jgi:hypothetical protein
METNIEWWRSNTPHKRVILKEGIMTFTKGKMYRQKVDSEQGYEDWEYTGITKEAPNGLWYAFKNDLGVYYFDENDLKEFKENTK